MTYEIPLRPMNQTCSVALAGRVYSLRLMWCAASLAWIMDILSQEGEPLVMGVPLVTGADLLEQYKYLSFGGKLFVTTDGDNRAPPTYENLGVNSHLYWEPDAE